jgi:hypothetical protein
LREDDNNGGSSNSAGNRFSKDVENDEKIFRTVKKVDRSSCKNAERNFKRIPRSLETPGRTAVKIA